MALARADLESLLRARRLDRTLTTALPPLPVPGDAFDEYAVGATGIAAVDATLGGGFPRGQLSEIVGPHSSGRASLLLRTIASATARGELVALVDALDMLDVASADAAGIDLSRLLWIRGHVVVHPGLCRDLNQRAMEQAIRALTLVLSAGNFGLVVFDLGEAPLEAIRRLPFTTWLRLQRLVEGSQTMAVLIGRQPMARSSAGLTVVLGQAGLAGEAKAGGAGGAGMPGGARLEEESCLTCLPRPTCHSGLFRGMALDARVVRARVRAHERASASFTTAAVGHV